MAVSSGPSRALAMMRAVCRSCNALVSHSRVRWSRASSIELASALQNLVLDGCAQMAVAVKLRPRLDKHVFAHVQIAETMMRPLHPAGRSLSALTDDHHQVHVTVFMWRAPRVRAKQKDLLRLELGFQPFHDLLQQT